MKKIYLFMIAFVLVSGAAFLVVSKDKKPSPQTETTATSVAVEPTESQPTTASNPGAYATYSQETLAAAKGTKLLFFYAPWCPQCRSLDADITARGVPENTTILKVDYDSNQALRQKYGVTIQTTIVRVDENGNLVKKYVAYDEPTLASVVKNLL